jgi:hypothetical protein
MSDFTDETILPTKGDPLFLGVIGGRADATQEKILEDVITPMLQELGRMPDRIILPADGLSTIFISDWSERLKLPTQIYEADWRRHQRRAKIFRDARIQQESTHFLIFLNKRSDYNEKLAVKLAKQGRVVFTVTYSDWSLDMLSLPTPEPAPEIGALTEKVLVPSSRSPPPRPTKRGNKLDTGKGRAQKQSRPSTVPGNQPLLTSLWEA